jgi:hypothetical protein
MPDALGPQHRPGVYRGAGKGRMAAAGDAEKLGRASMALGAGDAKKRSLAEVYQVLERGTTATASE